jgi:hypothetical protein
VNAGHIKKATEQQSGNEYHIEASKPVEQIVAP